jgi:GT2 family glycosyltransferase
VEEEDADGLATVGEWPGIDISGIPPSSVKETAVEKPVDVSVVVVNWNGAELLPECLASIGPGAGRLTAEVIVVDNGSTDGSVEYLRTRHPGVKLIVNSKHLAFGAANNLAFESARGSKILLLNSDARLRPGTLSTLSDFLDGRPDSAAVTPALVGGDGKPQNAFDNLPTLTTELLNKHLFRALFPERFPGKKRKASSPVEVESAIGACLLLRREALDKAGTFDESFFFFLEETDLCRRLRGQGYGIHFHPGVEAVHLGGASKAKARAEAWIEYYRSLYRYFSKNEKPWIYRALRAGRFAKLIFNTVGTWIVLQASMGMHDRSRRRFPVYLRLLSWHLRGCPEGEGLQRD